VEEADIDAPDQDTADELAPYSAVSRLAEQLAQDHADEEFQASLTNLLDRLEHLNGLPSPAAQGR